MGAGSSSPTVPNDPNQATADDLSKAGPPNECPMHQKWSNEENATQASENSAVKVSVFHDGFSQISISVYGTNVGS